ncbi:MAG: sulfate adenylyltransferase subunit CysD, partial [Chryseolinea sp.]
ESLKAALTLHGFDAAFGGARRDEEKSRAKERVFSFRDKFHRWDPKNQRPELWNLFNGRKHIGEHFRVFPISNWTEMDVWQYIQAENIPIPKLYYTHQREVIIRDGSILSTSPWLKLKENEKPKMMTVRFRTCGDMPITGAVESDADTVEKIIEEVAASRKTERGTRADDKRSETAMEDRKKSGYF